MTRRVVFFVDTTSRRSEAMTAARSLGRALRKRGHWRSTFVANDQEWDAPADGDLAVAAVPAVDPRRLPAAALKVAWLQRDVDRWLARTDLAAYDLVLAPSTLALADIRELRAGESALLLPAVDAPRALQRLRRPRTAVIRRRNPDLAYGVVGAELLRILARDSLPITDSAIGLDDFGLEETPVRRSATMPQGATRATGSANASTQVARRLGTEVREQHSWRQRAADFVSHVDRANERAADRAVLGFYPDFRSTNAFQTMLYSEAANAGVDVLPIGSATADLAQHFRGRRVSRYAFHLHWTSAVLSSAADEGEARERLGRFEGRVRELKSRGGHLVWTVHNVLPHENRYPELELRLNRFLAARADLVHVMNPDTAELTRELYELPADRTRLIPHASYMGVYPDAVSREHARHRLGIPPSDKVVLYAGSIRPYKGLDVLLDAFDRAVDDDPSLRLIVAGRVNQFAEPDAERLVTHVSEQRRCISRLEHIPDQDLQMYYRAADVAVFPYRAILNSGSLLLSLSFAVPVLAPSLPGLRSQLDPAWSETFEPESVDDLRRALLRAAVRLNRPSARSAAWERAEAYRPRQMSVDFFAALRPILG